MKINHDSSINVNIHENNNLYKYLLTKYDIEASIDEKNGRGFAYVFCRYSNLGKLDSIHLIGFLPCKFVDNTLDYFEAIDNVKFKGIKYKMIEIGFVITYYKTEELKIKAKILKVIRKKHKVNL
ncbi:MAG: hypothetical protein U0W24_13935 [Bacteroidales bacterium]